MLSPACDFLLFGLMIGSLGLPCALHLRGFAPLERLALGVAGALLLLYLAALGLYATSAPWIAAGLLPVAGLGAAWPRRAAARELWSDPEVRGALTGWLLLSLWCLGWHALIVSYSGGGWAGDWDEHYERALFFLHHWPADYRFIGFNLLPARPPLANLATAAILGVTGDGMVHYQVATTLLSTLFFFPLAALVRRWSEASPAGALLALLLMLNPLVVQNATFPWTKLAAAFFVVLATLLLQRTPGRDGRPGWAAIALTAGVLTHYSVMIWAIALGAGWWWSISEQGKRGVALRESMWAAPLSLALLLTWFGWAAIHYAPEVMLTATSTVGLAPEAGWGGRVIIALQNIRHTLMPDLDSPVLATFMRQPDLLSRLRDFCFCLYQQSLPIALGLGNLCLCGWLLARRRDRSGARFWFVAIPLAVVLGATVHTWPVDLGVTHICLQPLVLLAIAGLAAAAQDVPFWLRIVWVVGAAVDLVLGILLHFGLQSLLLLQWTHPGEEAGALIYRLTGMAVLNFRGKLRLAQPFLADPFHEHAGVIIAVLAGLLIAAGLRCFLAGRKMASPAASSTP